MPLSKEETKAMARALAKEKNYDEEKTKKLEELLDDDVAGPILSLPVSRHADYSKQADELTKFKKKLETWHKDEAVPVVNKALADRDAMAKKVKAYESKYGPLEDVQDLGGGKGVTATGKVVDMDEVNKLLVAERGNMAGQLTAFLRDQNKLTVKHAKLFKGEILDTEPLMAAIAKAAEDGKQISLIDAYDELYGDKVKDVETRLEKERIEAIKEEGRKEERARIASGSKTGAVIPENGTFWSHISNQSKQQAGQPAGQQGQGQGQPGQTANQPGQQSGGVSDLDREALFNADLQAELSKRNMTSDDL